MDGLNTNVQPPGTFDFQKTAQNFKTQVRSDNLLLVILFGIFIFVVVYLLILYNKPNLLNYTLSPTPVKMNNETIMQLPNTDKLPTLTNGREYAYSFWLYLESVDSDNKYNLVFLRSPNTDSNYLQNANPIVYLDKNSNKLVIKVRTVQADTLTFNNLDDLIANKTFADIANVSIPSDGSTCEQTVNLYMNNQNMSREEAEMTVTTTDPNSKDVCSLTNQNNTVHNDNCKYATFKIDYVPLQRWVNIIINVNNNMLAVILDGAIHSTRVLNEDNNECPGDSSSKLVSPTVGSVMVGDIIEDTNNMPAANGFISRLQFFNYSLKTPSHIKKIYNAGPVKSVGVLQKLGLPLYGFRNPLYRVDAVKAE